MLKNRSMPKKQGPVRTAVQPLGSENRDQTASHGSLWIWTLKKKKIIKKNKGKTKENETQLPIQRNTETQLPLKRKKKVHHVYHCHLQRNTACLYVSSPSLFRAHHAAPSLQKLFSWAKQALNSSFVLRWECVCDRVRVWEKENEK